MNTENIFSACAARDSNPDQGMAGTLEVRQFSLAFEAEGFQAEMPLMDLQISAHPLEKDKVVFRHHGFPGVSVETYDRRILDHRNLTQRSGLWPQIESLRAETEGPDSHHRAVYAAVAGLAGIFLLLWLGNNALLRWIVSQAPDSWEQDVGKEIMAEAKTELEMVSDPEMTNRLHAIAQRIVAALPKDRQKSFHFYLVKDPQMNAFALPGGHIIVLTGLLESSESPEELAGVLAHEMAHVTERHSLRRAAESAGPMFVAKYFMGSRNNLLKALAVTSSFMSGQRYSRQHESEADEKGWDYLVKANVDPKGMISFMKKLQAIEGHSRAGLNFLSSHPPTSERVEALEKKREGLRKGQIFIPFPPETFPQKP